MYSSTLPVRQLPCCYSNKPLHMRLYELSFALGECCERALSLLECYEKALNLSSTTSEKDQMMNFPLQLSVHEVQNVRLDRDL